jgi:DNA-binding transcriptional MerR regulator
MPRHRIGDAARLSGVSAANIRYYEKEGLLAAQARADSGYRLYSDDEVHRLRLVRLCRAMDMSLDEVRTLLGLDLRDKRDCAAARRALDEHLGHVRARMAELRSLEGRLVALRDRCDGADPHCHTIEALHAQADAQQDGERGSPARRHV